MEIKKADKGLLKELVANRMEFLKDMRNHEITLSEDFEKATYEYMKEHMEDDSMVTWIAEENGAIVSIAMVCYYELLPHLSNKSGKTGYIFNVFTAPEYRRCGLASGLINEIIRDSKERNVGKLFLTASEMGKPVYEKLGFEVLTRDMALIL